MNKHELQGTWLEFAGQVKKRWAKLSDNDLLEIKGNQDILIAKLQKLYWLSADEAREQIKEIEQNLKKAAKGAEKMYQD